MPSKVVLNKELLDSRETIIYTGLTDEDMNGMVGRILTIMEAAIPSGSQLEAIKSIAKQEMWSTFNAPTGDWINIKTGDWDKEKENYSLSGELGYPMYTNKPILN